MHIQSPHETAWISCGFFENEQFFKSLQMLEEFSAIVLTTGHLFRPYSLL